MTKLVAVDEWPFVVVLTDEEQEALSRDGEVQLCFIPIDADVLRLFWDQP